jgi:hypothetical protein
MSIELLRNLRHGSQLRRSSCGDSEPSTLLLPMGEIDAQTKALRDETSRDGRHDIEYGGWEFGATESDFPDPFMLLGDVELGMGCGDLLEQVLRGPGALEKMHSDYVYGSNNLNYASLEY